MSWGILLLLSLPNCKNEATSNFLHFWFWFFFLICWLDFFVGFWGDFVVLFCFPLYFLLHLTSVYFLLHMAGMLLWQWIAQFH